ncbi:ShlB/FhaC/HecB family hemolysin secretion/activation protein [Marinobacter sp. GN3S48]|uniref:ShlB/FhaC/HecB family hemolysin secretion/activation protein n=1 Tax=Marinobacter sp. GN3S48 TaxID=3382302 RepID=UPI00387B915A
MKYPLLIALIWCVFSQSLYAQSSGSWLRNGWKPYANNFAGGDGSFREEREHWLRSQLKFSGKTSLTSDGLDGAIGVSADNLVGRSDDVSFNYRDLQSRKDGSDFNSTSFHYRFPAGPNELSLKTSSSRYQRAVSNAGRRYNASGDSRALGIGASRPLFSRFGVAIDGIARHAGRDSRTFEEGSLVSESSYQLSSLGVKADGRHELVDGIHANTGILAVSGREYTATDYRLRDNVGEEDEFYKVAMSASIEQELWRWRWQIHGRYQFADEDLPVSEYLTVAGPSMIAGFNGQSVSAIRGGWLRMDTASPSWPMPFVDGVLSSVNFSVLHGWVPYTEMQSDRHGRASAGQVSLKLKGRAFSANVSVGRMIRTSTVAVTMPNNPDVRFSLTMGI